MVIILGGAFQGKLDYAKETWHLSDEMVFTCEDKDVILDTSKVCIDHLEKYALACINHNLEPKAAIMERIEELSDCILICEDIFCGVVPVDPQMRAWREATGRMMNELCGHAEKVIRLFCGIPQVLK